MTSFTHTFRIEDYNVPLTLASGQAFRWTQKDGGWVGVADNRWIRLRADESSIVAEVASPVTSWGIPMRQRISARPNARSVWQAYAPRRPTPPSLGGMSADP